MTALATIAGMLPLAFGIGSGSEMLQPLAIAVIGGVLISMVLSLLVTPADVSYNITDPIQIKAANQSFPYNAIAIKER